MFGCRLFKGLISFINSTPTSSISSLLKIIAHSLTEEFQFISGFVTIKSTKIAGLKYLRLHGYIKKNMRILGEKMMEQVLREVHLEGTFNFRELGGYPTSDGRRVKSGILFRSGNLSRLTEQDFVTISKLGIKNICDLRDDDEVGNHPDPVIEGATWNHISLVNDEKAVRQVGDLSQFESKLMNSKPGEMLTNLNRDLVANTTAFEKIFRVLLDEPGKPMLFHCMAGKDRTGAVAALLLSVIGVARDVIEEDYLYTNNTLEAMQEDFNAIGYTMPDFIDKEVVQAMYEARVEYINAFFDEIEREYGSVESYVLNGIGLEKEDITKLRSYLLD